MTKPLNNFFWRHHTIYAEGRSKKGYTLKWDTKSQDYIISRKQEVLTGEALEKALEDMRA